MAKPEATFVAVYRKWQTFNRFVRKGDHGIPILAPIFDKVTNKDGEKEQCLVGFRVVYVFDVSQTEGEPLLEIPEWKSPEKNAKLMNKLTKYAQNKGIKIVMKHIGNDIQGISIGDKIIVDPEAGTKTLIHEIAHELLHHVKNASTSRTIPELEAESIAYVVACHFGLDNLSSPKYNALHGATAEMIIDHLERIRKVATELVQALESSTVPAMSYQKEEDLILPLSLVFFFT